MRLVLKKIKDTPKGRIVEQKEIAIIEYDGTNTYVKCMDKKLKETLDEIFSQSFTVRKPSVRDGIRSFVMETVKPNTPEYIREISYLLRKADFYVIIK